MAKKESSTPKKRTGKYCRQKGHSGELRVIKLLEAIGYKGLKSSRSESKNLDNDKIDIAETIDKLPFYVQVKVTKNYPDVTKNIKDCPRKDRPLVIFWNKQIDKGTRIGSDGKYVIMTEDYFLELIKTLKNE